MSIINILIKEATEPLPMDDPSRMERAKQMGFDTSTVYYHGTPDSRGIHKSGFEDEYRSPRAFFFSPSHKLANSYADDRRAFDYQNAEPEVLSVFLKFSNPKHINWGGHNFRYKDLKGEHHDIGKHIEQAHKSGHDAVVVKNISDEYGGNGKNYHGSPSSIVVVFDPKQIRSVKAKFDPDKADTPMIHED